MKPRVKKLAYFAPLAIGAIALFIAIGGVIVQQLWNWLLPAIFGVRQIGFWQALGILLLCRILFGGFGFQGSGRSSLRRHSQKHFEQMTPEERERFRRGFGKHFGLDADAGRET